jgi:hypothetical protein
MMDSTDPEHDLRAALDAFETSLAIPVVSGELDAWSQQVRTTWAEASEQVDLHLSELHPKQFKQIAKEDPELLSQVDNMKAEDAALAGCQASINRLVEELSKLAPAVEPDERKFHEYNARLIKDGIEFVGRVKKQQVGVRTWFQEAFNRDRGVAD